MVAERVQLEDRLPGLLTKSDFARRFNEEAALLYSLTQRLTYVPDLKALFGGR